MFFFFKFGSDTKSHVLGDQNTQLKTYTNYRFGFEVDYPSSWILGRSPDNGDGRNLYDAPETEILVYGSYTPWTFSTQDAPIERGIIVLNDGRKATYLKELKNRKINYIVFFNQTDSFSKSEMQYVLNANVPKDFFQQHEKEIISAAKSIRLIDK